MKDEHDELLIDEYIDRIQPLATQAQHGENVTDSLQAVIKNACRQFSLGTPDKERANLAALKSMLGVLALATEISQPEVRKTLEYAQTLVHKCEPQSGK
jgi:hypothetical protein